MRYFYGIEIRKSQAESAVSVETVKAFRGLAARLAWQNEVKGAEGITRKGINASKLSRAEKEEAIEELDGY